MTRQRSFTATGTAFLLFLTSACGADGTGPDDEESEFVTDMVAVNIEHIEVTHDCDPAWDNPGDFQGYVEIQQDPNPGGDDFRVIAASPKRTILLNSGESANGDHIRAEIRVPRDPTRPVKVRGVFHELDNGVADAWAERVEVIYWDTRRNCWTIANTCMLEIGTDEYYRTWTHDVHTRDDVWSPFNSDDEGCEFRVTFATKFGGS